MIGPARLIVKLRRRLRHDRGVIFLYTAYVRVVCSTKRMSGSIQRKMIEKSCFSRFDIRFYLYYLAS